MEDKVEEDYFREFVKNFYRGKTTNLDVVLIVEEYGVSKFFRGLYLYLFYNIDSKEEIGATYTIISQVYHTSRILFDERQ